MDKLREAGLEVPQSTELLFRLNALGYEFAPGILTADDCVAAILAKLSRTE